MIKSTLYLAMEQFPESNKNGFVKDMVSSEHQQCCLTGRRVIPCF